jgi:hypothetical protein
LRTCVAPNPHPHLPNRPNPAAAKPPQFLPSLYVLAGAAAAAGLQAWTSIAFLLLAPYCCWVYLRFFQAQPETTLKGDPSEDFKFSSFFPDAMQVGACVSGWGGGC